MGKAAAGGAPALVRSAVAILTTVLLAACGGGQKGNGVAPNGKRGSAFPITLKDDEGVSVTLRRAPQRIVTFGQSDTEIVFALGLGNRLVGVCCAFDNYPPAAARLPHVEGAAQKPNTEKVISLHPDVLLNAFPGASTWSKPLQDAGVPVFTTTANNFDDAVHDIVTVGRVLGAKTAADALASRMRAAEHSVQTRVASDRAAAGPVSCFLDIGGLYTVAPGDFLYDLLRQAGCVPVTSDAKTSFPQWSKEQLVQDDPDVYLFTSDSGTTLASLEKDPALGKLSAVKNHRVYSVNGDLVSRPGPRLVQGLEAIAKAMHPNAFS
jgi:iron complex transport system substrate-binding protein